jgi:hypothetical protein
MAASESPEEIADAIVLGRRGYLQIQKTILAIRRIEDWQRDNGLPGQPGIAAMRQAFEDQVGALVPRIRNAEAGLAAMIPSAAAEDLLAKAEAAQPPAVPGEGEQVIEQLAGILTGPGSLETKQALVTQAFGN